MLQHNKKAREYTDGTASCSNPRLSLAMHIMGDKFMINLMDLADTVITLEETAPDTVEMKVQTQDGTTTTTLHRNPDGVLVEQKGTAHE